MIVAAHLELYTDDDDAVSIDLSPTQLAVVLKMLGIKDNGNGTYNAYSDKGLRTLIKSSVNPLHLKDV